METRTQMRGTCLACGKDFATDASGCLVEHGFEISDKQGNYFGFRSGNCLFVGVVADELSTEQVRTMIDICKTQFEKTERNLNALRTEEPNLPKKIYKGRCEFETVMISKTDDAYEWDSLFKAEEWRLVSILQVLTKELTRFNVHLATWTARPLMSTQVAKAQKALEVAKRNLDERMEMLTRYQKELEEATWMLEQAKAGTPVSRYHFTDRENLKACSDYPATIDWTKNVIRYTKGNINTQQKQVDKWVEKIKSLS